MADIISALHALRPGASWSLDGYEYSGLNWVDTVQTKPTEQEVNDEIVQQNAQDKLDDCKATAKSLLLDTDWVELPSVGDSANSPHVVNVVELIVYRAQLRVLAVNPVSNPTWPTKPEVQWSN